MTLRTLLSTTLLLSSLVACGDKGEPGDPGPAGADGAAGEDGADGQDAAGVLVSAARVFARDFGCADGYEVVSTGVDDGAGGGTAGDGVLQEGEVHHASTVCLAPDVDGDGYRNLRDVCPETDDPEQADADLDGAGDACDETVDEVRMWAITKGDSSTESELWSYDPVQNTAERIGATGHALVAIQVNPADGRLYGVARGDFGDAWDEDEDFAMLRAPEDMDPGGCDGCLVELDPETGAATVVTALDVAPLPSIAFLSDGSMVGWTEAGDRFGHIDMETGAWQGRGDGYSSAGHAMCGTAEDRVLWVEGDGEVFEIDPADGEMDALGDLWDVSGDVWAQDSSRAARGDCTRKGSHWIGVVPWQSPGEGLVVSMRFGADGQPLVEQVKPLASVDLHHMAFAD